MLIKLPKTHLCPTNNDVEFINDMALERMRGEAMVFTSIDQPLDSALEDEFNTFRSDFNLEAIHAEMPSGMPPHKVGALVMLIRNLDVSQGLCNGTRMQIMRMTDENLYCRILTGPRAGLRQLYIIPRIRFEYGQNKNHRGLRFRRLQFPIRVSFGMIVNKAQGQTLKKMGLVLNGGQCFSHGQVYVAMSRVMEMDGIRVFSPTTYSEEGTSIKNVMYHELLDFVLQPRPQITDPVGARRQQEIRSLEEIEDANPNID